MTVFVLFLSHLVMYRNGVSHLLAQDDLKAMIQAVKWLSYVPARKGLPLPRFIKDDTWDRSIDYMPPKGPYDPRWMLDGKAQDDGTYLSGFFDRGSWQETLGGWATSVIVGRARLGGIPMGVIAVETRTLERIVPADPANPNSQEQRIMEAGQVWYPNSAYKTAQAIADFNREGLPLIIFANWRGFSGGQQDMFDQVLKYGSYIVDGLTSYRQPVFVHIPPNGELRGGAFVVVDSKIHQDGLMELSTDELARGGVLEPEGMVEIKIRQPQQRAWMERLDPVYHTLRASSAVDAHVQRELSQREEDLAPVLNSIAVAYADAHDKAGRMYHVGVARTVLPWNEARRYFYQRLRRRLAEVDMQRQLHAADPALTARRSLDMLRRAILGSVPENASDEAVADVLESDQARTLLQALVEATAEEVLLERLAALPAGARQRLLG